MRIGPRDPRTARLVGEVKPSLRGAVRQAELELVELFDALGGVNRLTPTTRAVVEDAVSVGLVLRGELGRYLQSGDHDAASRVGTLASARRQSFALLGLDPRPSEPRSIASIAAAFSQENEPVAERVAPARQSVERDRSM